MPRDKLPEDLQELVGLCLSGRLFDVQEWIAAGRRVTVADGDFRVTPFIAAIRSGFHSMVEVFLRARLIHQEELVWGMREAASMRRLDLIELLAEHGADPTRLQFSYDILGSRHPTIIRWFIDHGADLETDNPIATAFQGRHREFLGIYMGIRDKVPSARRQATMALRYHAGEGNLKWVSLLLWAGADPRMPVPEMDGRGYEEGPEDWRSALEEAISRRRLEVFKRIGLKVGVDDLSALLTEASFSCQPEIVRALLEAGADPNKGEEWRNPMRRMINALGWELNPIFRTGDPDRVLTCLEMATERGGRWKPDKDDDLSSLRRAISKYFKTSEWQTISVLRRLAKSGALEKDAFRDLMRTPRMREVLQSSHAGVEEIRRFADFTMPRRAKVRRS